MTNAHLSCRAIDTPVDVRDIGEIEYTEAWALQRRLAQSRADGSAPDSLLLLQHPPVYTAGKRTEDDERPTDGTPVIDVDRGGKLTWHGPGQLVGYPIIGLAEPMDVVDYVRRLEQALIAVCDALGVTDAGRVDGRSGVWLPAADGRPERKIASIGIRVQRGVTMHGFEINCDNDLTPFDNGIPCGIRGVGATSVTAELGRDVTVAEVLPLARDAVLAALDGALPVTERWIRRQPQADGVEFVLST
ncbi:MAG: lipoyl(octanoyl) transferase LipB [Sciscionella sp.]|nr:lipoyl(octanoyl) transferase LipB [Sciscionella sp.]